MDNFVFKQKIIKIILRFFFASWNHYSFSHDNFFCKTAYFILSHTRPFPAGHSCSTLFPSLAVVACLLHPLTYTSFPSRPHSCSTSFPSLAVACRLGRVVWQVICSTIGVCIPNESLNGKWKSNENLIITTRRL